MKLFLSLLTAGMLTFGATDSFAQPNRDIGAQRVILDDGAGNTLTLEYTGSSNATYTFTGGGGSIPNGSVAGQTLRWDGTSWLASGALTNDGTNLTFGGTLTGDGSLLTSLDAGNVSSGTLNDLRLSANVPLLNAANTFSAANTFTGNFTLNPTTGFAGLTMTPTNTILTGRDEAGADFPLIVTADVTGQVFGVDTYGRMLRLEQTPTSHFYDMGIDATGNLFIGNHNALTPALQVNAAGGVTLPSGSLALTAGNITLSGTVDGVDISTADAANVKLTGDQSIAGNKTLTGTTTLSGITNLTETSGGFITADNTLLAAPTSSFIEIASDDPVPANRTFTLANGTTTGQLLIIKMAVNGAELQDAGNARLSGDMLFESTDMLTLIWDNSISSWIEVSRSDN